MPFALVGDAVTVDRLYVVDIVVGCVIAGLAHHLEEHILVPPIDREDMVRQTHQYVLLQDLGTPLDINLGLVHGDGVPILRGFPDGEPHDGIRLLLGGRAVFLAYRKDLVAMCIRVSRFGGDMDSG